MSNPPVPGLPFDTLFLVATAVPMIIGDLVASGEPNSPYDPFFYAFSVIYGKRRSHLGDTRYGKLSAPALKFVLPDVYVYIRKQIAQYPSTSIFSISFEQEFYLRNEGVKQNARRNFHEAMAALWAEAKNRGLDLAKLAEGFQTIVLQDMKEKPWSREAAFFVLELIAQFHNR